MNSSKKDFPPFFMPYFHVWQHFTFSCGSDIEPHIQEKTKPGELSLQKLIIALKANKNPEKMLAEKHDLEKYLSDKLNRQVEVIIPTDSATVVESFQTAHSISAILARPMLPAILIKNTASILWFTLKMENLTTTAFGLRLKNKPYKSITELKGKPVAFASRSSTSGFLIPTWDLAKQGFVGPESPSLIIFLKLFTEPGMFLQLKKFLVVKLKRLQSATMFSKETINI